METGSEFLKKSEELKQKVSEISVRKQVAYTKVMDAQKELVKDIENLKSLEIPVINGEKIFDFDIDVNKLGDYMYVKKLCEILPACLAKIEQTGTELIDNAIK